MKTTLFRFNVFWYVLFALLGFVAFWTSRYNTNPDFIAYADIADAYLRGDWRYALNSSWPPLFSWLLMIPIALTDSPESETISCHLLQYCLYLGALATLALVIRELLRKYLQSDTATPLSPRPAIVASVCWLIGGALLLSTQPIVLTPDILQVPIILLLLYLLIVNSTRPLSPSYSICVATLIAIGYYAKSVFLPLAPFIILSSVVLSPVPWKKRILYAALECCLVLGLVSPFVVAISVQQGRFTYGDSGKINYGLFVSQDVYRYTEGNLTEENLWIAPTEYPYHIPGRVDRAVWEDPTQVDISAYDMAASFAWNCRRIYWRGGKMLLLGMAAVVLLAVCFRCWRTSLMPPATNALLLFPAVVAMSAYVSILYLPRYVHSWLIWAALVVIAGAWSANRIPRRWNVLRSAAMVLLVLTSILFLRESVTGYRNNLAKIPKLLGQYEAAKRVCQLDIRDICVIGRVPVGSPSLGERHPTSSVLWVRYTPCRIRAVYPEGQKFYSLKPSELKEVLARLAREKIDAVIFQSPPQVHPNWTDLGGGYYIVGLADYRDE